MKTTILGVLALLAAMTGRAQTEFEAQASVTEAVDRTVSPTECSEWLAPFDAVEVDASAEIRFVAVPATEAPRIVYDTKGDDNTKFRAEVRGGVLRIRERAHPYRSERTSVTVCYNTLRSLKLTDAKASFGSVLTAPMFDLTVGARSTLDAEIDVQDLAMELSGDSRAMLTGKVRYLTLEASTGRVDAEGLVCESAVVTAKNKARVTLDATDRLEAATATEGTIGYKRTPALLRTAQNLLAGSIGRVE